MGNAKDDQVGIFGFGRADTTRAQNRSYRLVRIGSKRSGSREVKVNSYARVILEDAARNDVVKPLVPAKSEYAVGDTVPHRGRYWTVGRTCFKCYASGWTLLQPVRTMDDEGLLPTPIARPCPHVTGHGAKPTPQVETLVKALDRKNLPPTADEIFRLGGMR